MGRHRPLCGSLHKGRKPILVNGSFTVSQRRCQLCSNEARKATGSLRPKVDAAGFDGPDAGLVDYRDYH